MMRAFNSGGFGSDEAGRIRVCEIGMTGVSLSEEAVEKRKYKGVDGPEEDGELMVSKDARCWVNVELEVQSSNANWVSVQVCSAALSRRARSRSCKSDH